MRKLIVIAFVLLISINLHSQIVIEGPSCAMSGFEYQYAIKGITDRKSINVCITGGSFTDSKISCRDITAGTVVMVKWNGDTHSGSISMNGEGSSSSKTVSVTPRLQPGQVDLSFKDRKQDRGITPPLLQCTMPHGGHCSPSYRFQWQSSPDHIQWTDIEGATNQNLDISKAIEKAIYYRRKVTEINSGTIGFSTTATILINDPANQDNSTNPAK